jgi:hypothetical protein
MQQFVQIYVTFYGFLPLFSASKRGNGYPARQLENTQENNSQTRNISTNTANHPQTSGKSLGKPTINLTKQKFTHNFPQRPKKKR